MKKNASIKIDLRRFRKVKSSLETMNVTNAAKKHRLSRRTVKRVQRASSHTDYKQLAKAEYARKKKNTKRDIVVKKSKTRPESITVTTSAVREARELDAVPLASEPLFEQKPSLLDRIRGFFNGR